MTIEPGAPETEVDLAAIPEQAMEHGQAPSGRPLGAPSAGEPASEDSLVNFGGQAQSPNMHLITGSDKAKEYMLRGRLNAKQVAAIKQIIADENQVKYGDPDLMGLIAYEFNASAGIDGQARDDFMKVSTGLAKAMAGMRGFFGRGADGVSQPQGNGP